ncbi:MAG: YhjD/YihY/BrkB family envelope integrity protein [Candidatus Omnitrophota bacterium]
MREFLKRPLSHSFVVKYLYVLRIAVNIFNKKGVWAHASVCGYATILSMVPVAAISLIILSAFTFQDPELKEYRMEPDTSAPTQESPFDGVVNKYEIQNSSFSNRVFDFIFDHFVPGAASGARAELLEAKQTILEFIQRASALRFVTLFLLILTCVSLYNSIEHAFNEIWAVQRRRTLFSRFLACWLLLTLTPILLGLSYYYSSRFEASGFASRWMGQEWTSWLINHIVSYGLTLFAFFFSNRYLPNLHVNFFPALVGSALSAILWEAAKVGFDLYIKYVTSQPSSYYSIFGTVAAIPIFILWLYYSYLCFLLGPVIACAIQDFDKHVARLRQKEWFTLHRPVHSLKIFLEICRHFREREGGYSLSDLRQETGWTEEQVKRCLRDLEQVRLIHQERRENVYYPNGDFSRLLVSDAMERLIGLKSPDAARAVLPEPWQQSLQQTLQNSSNLTIANLLEASK